MKFLSLLVCSLAFGWSAAADTGWTLVWSDEFTQPDGSSPDSSKWAYDTGAGGWGNSELEYYTSRTNNVRIENNQLVIEARQESYMGSSYTSSRLKTQGKMAWTYGRIEARIKIPRGQGIWPAFWTLGSNITVSNWPLCGEIDIMENIGKEPTLVHGTVHGPGYSGGNGIGSPYSLPGNATFADDFHIYAIEWTTNQLKWFVDGQQYFSVTPSSLPVATNWVFTKPQFLLLNVAVGGIWPGNPDGSTVFPQRMTVDYVRVYTPTNLPACDGNALISPGFEGSGLAGWTTYPGGANTLLENISHVPVHNGSNVFKVYGQFTGGLNFSGILQDFAVVPGQSFTADGWGLTPAGDSIAGANTAWIEVSFRNSVNNVLALYRSALISSSTPAGSWLNLAVTNQLDPSTQAVIGTVTNLVAPVGTVVARYQVVFRQPAVAAGAVLFDDLRLAVPGGSEFPVETSISGADGSVNLGFATYLSQPYQIRWKSDLLESDWQVLTNISGDGTLKTLAVDGQYASRYYQVVRLCN